MLLNFELFSTVAYKAVALYRKLCIQFKFIWKFLIAIYFMFQDDAFYHKGNLNGPSVTMTDNCDELKDALHAVWAKIPFIVVYISYDATSLEMAI